MNISLLFAPFPRASVHWRVQGQPFERNGNWSAMALAYIDARDVMDRLDDACGPENWQSEITETAKGRVVCRLGIRMGDEWVWKSDGAGDTAVEGEKGGISDALKRAAVSWGVGRYLYRLSSPWVPCEINNKGGKTYWKKWAADPWQFVKDAPQEPSPQEIVAAITSITSISDMNGLQAFWGDLYKGSRHIADHPAVMVAKDNRKDALSQKEAA